jgi:AraC-like DNA-binding protein
MPTRQTGADAARQGAGSTYSSLARLPDVSVHSVSCSWQPGSEMSEVFRHVGLTLVRRGMYVRTSPGREDVVDPTSAYFEQPGIEQQVIHPRGGGGETTVVLLSDTALGRYAGDATVPDELIPLTPRIHLIHLALLADLDQGVDPHQLDARLVSLVGEVIERAAPGRLTSRRKGTAVSHRRIVNHVREAVASDPASVGLRDLARELGHTPFHISRVFRRATGTTLTEYRNRVRVSAAIERLAGGEDRLADLAAELGFVDQSHLARILRKAVGVPPGRLRHHLAG